MNLCEITSYQETQPRRNTDVCHNSITQYQKKNISKKITWKFGLINLLWLFYRRFHRVTSAHMKQRINY